MRGLQAGVIHCWFRARDTIHTFAFPVICRDHVEVFQKNGFGFTEGEDGRLLLCAVPFSQKVIFRNCFPLEGLGKTRSKPVHMAQDSAAELQLVYMAQK